MTNPLPCPRCGKSPTLVSAFKHARTEPSTSNSIHLLRYECSKWFGFSTCFKGPDYHWIEKGWYDVGIQEATRKWNELVTNYEYS